jgi:hypothetical protein
MEEQQKEKNRSAKTDINNTSTKGTEKEQEKSISIKKLHIKNLLFPISPINTKIISSIALNLQEIINKNLMNIKYSYRKGDPFYTFHLPLISLDNYIKRIFFYTKIDISTLIIAIIYLDTFCDMNRYILCINNIHRIIMASCVLSIKFNEDLSFGNDYYAKMANFSLDLLNRLEYEFYVMMNFKLFVNNDIYRKYYAYFTRD